MMRDVRQALSQLQRARGFTIIVLIVLALGTSANLTLFSLLDALVLRSLPVSRPNRLVAFSASNANQPFDVASLPASALPLFAQQGLFSAIAGYVLGSVTVVTDGVPSEVGIDAVTGEYFEVLDMRPVLGRLLTNDDVATSAAVAVISEGYWQRRYARDPRVLGKTVRLDGMLFTVVGVTPHRFSGMDVGLPADVTVPLGTVRQIAGLPADDPIELDHGIGRLRDDVTLERARTQLVAVWPRILRVVVPSTLTPMERDEYLTRQLQVTPAATGFSYMRDWYAKPLYVLVAATGWLLLMTCANLACLLLGRMTGRQREMQVRSALGASRWRLVRQVLAECVVLSVVGTAIGIPLAWWISHGLVRLMWNRPELMPLDLTPDLRVAVVTGLSAVVTGLAFGIVPAWRASLVSGPFRPRPATLRVTSRWSEPLLVAQVALAVVLLVGAGLLARNLQRLRGSWPGFAFDDVLLARLVPQPGGYARPDVAAYLRELFDQLRVLPGVETVALSVPEPIMGLEAGEEKRLVAPSIGAQGTASVAATVVAVSPDFFRTMGVPLMRGRDFTWTDDGQRRPVAIVSAALAWKLYPATEAIGSAIRLGVDRRQQEIEIVGVTADARLADLHTSEPLFVFLPLLQGSPESARSPAIAIRSRAQSAGLDASVRRTVEALGHDYLEQLQPLAEQADTSLLRERLMSSAATFFGGFAVALVAVGLGGVVSYAVTHRTREIGIRAALGASPSALQVMVLKQALRVCALGLAFGLPCAWAASRMMARTFASVDAHDPLVFAGIALGVAVTAVSAAWLPARRAAAIEPVDALRCD